RDNFFPRLGFSIPRLGIEKPSLGTYIRKIEKRYPIPNLIPPIGHLTSSLLYKTHFKKLF
ncbi:hypothetical protein, partial [Bacteroides uniformis]